MKKNRSLRSMIFFLAVVLIIPILCFTLYLQVQTWRTMKHNLQRELEGELNTANHTLEMVIDKYDMVLYDFCTDDEIIKLVEQINESEKPSDAVKYQIRRNLVHICNRNVGVDDRNAKSGIRHSPDGAWAVKGCYRQDTFRAKRFHH